jgi:hypothetical protein
MAQDLLVDDLIADGQRLIDQLLADGFDVTVALWAKDDEGPWLLYLASPAFNDKKPGESFPAVYNSLSKVPDSTVELGLDIRLINDRNPIAREAARIAGHPGKKEGIRYRGTRLADLPIEEAYVYPKPEIPVRQAFIITYKRQNDTNQWSATTRREEYRRTLRPSGAVSYSEAQWLGGKEKNFAHVYVLVEVDPLLDERTIANNPVILITLAEQARAMADEMFESKHPGATIQHQNLVMNAV